MKILSFDIETSYGEYALWRPGTQYVDYKQMLPGTEPSILVASYSWIYPSEEEYTVPQNMFVDVSAPRDDKEITGAIAELLDEADVVITHNGDNFDRKFVNTRLVKHGYDPVPPLTSVDTLKISRRNFKFVSNRLDAIGEYLGLGRKIKTDLDLWKGILVHGETYRDKRRALKKMREYCDRDVELLNEVYFALRAYDNTHPSFNLVGGVHDACPTCANKTLVGNDSWITHKRSRAYPRFKCSTCNSWCRGVKAIDKVGYVS